MDKNDVGSIEKISGEIEAFRNESVRRGHSFASLTPEQVLEKLRSSSTPFITTVAWTSRNSASGSFFFQLYVRNPDSRPHHDVYAYFFFGPAHMIQDPAQALLSVDQRLYQGYELFPSIFPDDRSEVEFNYSFPKGIPLGTYFGNAFILDREVPVSPIYDRYNIPVEII